MNCEFVMSSIPLDFQRQRERRWTTRLHLQVEPAARWHRFEKRDQELAAQPSQEKTDKLNQSDLTSAPAE
jgi:hypothetical protein